jgi:hypothetical protein
VKNRASRQTCLPSRCAVLAGAVLAYLAWAQDVTKEEPIEKIYAQIEETLRNQYSLGYTPASKAPAVNTTRSSEP